LEYIVDRIESGIAICSCVQTGENLIIKKHELPKKIKEGDVLTKDGDGYKVDEEQTKKRLGNLTKRMNRLFDKYS